MSVLGQVSIERTTETIARYIVSWYDPVTGMHWKRRCITLSGARRKARRMQKRLDKGGAVASRGAP